MIVTKYALEIVVDDEVWQSNYGVNDSVLAVAEDIKRSMASIVSELVSEWLEKSGNSGAVRKIVSK